MDIKKVGHTIQIAGVVFTSEQENIAYIIMLPNEEFYKNNIIEFFTTEQWKEFLWQSDVLETEVKTTQGKAVIRKANRQIDNNISWKVYHRDNYTCRYCGRTGIPLTVDHMVLWEEGGPSIEENLLTACRRCNKTRGNTPYHKWINSNLYKKYASGIDDDLKIKNLQLINTIKNIPISFHKMRGKNGEDR